MPIIFSKSAEYATQAVLYIAHHASNNPILLREISDSLNTPHHFLSKILQLLARDGIVISHKGSHGGFNLGKRPEEITLGDVIRSIEGDSFLHGCVLGFPSCDKDNPCPVHPLWREAYKIILEMLDGKSIDELSKGISNKTMPYPSTAT